MKGKLVVFLMIGAIASIAAFADITSGTIQVIVTDSTGGALPGVTVLAESPDSITKRMDVTNSEGLATLVSLDPSPNYTVTTSLDGFGTSVRADILVKSAQTTTLRVTLSPAALAETVTVTAESPVVDTTSATTSQEITLELTEALPTGRSYQSYLQLAPGVLPDNNPTTSGNPAVRSGVNYSDIGGDLGMSSDNFYYIEGINVTDPVTGTFGANLNTEIIQEQKVIIGGIPAEFVGAPGLISSVITKSGGNEFSGSVNYFFQNDSMVADNENQGDATFEIADTAFTLGGPIVRDYAWFFGSYRSLVRDDDVTALDTNQFLRSVENDQAQAFGKLSWQFLADHRLTATFANDPTDITGLTNRDVLNTRDQRREQGGDRYQASYNGVFGSNVLVDASAGQHNGEVSIFSALEATRNDVIFQTDDVRTLADEQLGGEGNLNLNERDTDFAKASVEGIFDTRFGNHTLKAGVELENHINFRNSNYIGDAQYWSLPEIYAGQGISARDISEGSWTQLVFDPFNTSDFTGLLEHIDRMANAAELRSFLDLNGDGTITPDEVADAIVFDSSQGNPHGLLNYSRRFQTAAGPQETETEGTVFYVQDTVQVGQLAVNLGVRAEEWAHFATTGEEIFTFDWEFAPRISAIYDLKGDGRQKVSAYYGRYYDPIRMNMTNFAGTLTGRILEEQVWIGDQWVPYRTRGGPVVQDAFFAPTTKTPYTDDYQISYAIDLGRNMSFETNVWMRQTRDILEDYDLELYAVDGEGNTAYPGPIDDPNSLWLGLEYFGYTENPGSNFVIATLAGGKRDTEGVDLIFRKRFSNDWQLLGSYTWSDGDGNTNSDSNADFQGDVLFLDPRAPNQMGRQPGHIEHLFKVAGSMRFFERLELGAIYNWNSGTAASKTFFASRRNLPNRVPAGQEFEFAGFLQRWIAPDTVGALENPSYGVLDLRAEYTLPVMQFDLEMFVDVFNVLDDQSVIREQDLLAGQGSSAFGEAIQWVAPRRFFVGARLNF
ncbi:MAG: carboxypeptidase regulatory-like domain-containing protein [Thermoanaerobaculia bacterium]